MGAYLDWQLAQKKFAQTLGPPKIWGGVTVPLHRNFVTSYFCLTVINSISVEAYDCGNTIKWKNISGMD